MPTLRQVFPRLFQPLTVAPAPISGAPCPGGGLRGGRYRVVSYPDSSHNAPPFWKLSDVVHFDSPTIVREGAPYLGPLCPHELALLEDCHQLKPDWHFTVTAEAA